MFPLGNILFPRDAIRVNVPVREQKMPQTYLIDDASSLGREIRRVRRDQGLTQDELALVAGVSRRFVIEVEGGKETSRVGKVLHLLQILGIRVHLEPPPGDEAE